MDQPTSLFNPAQHTLHLVVGSSGGIGAALTQQLSALGHTLITTSRRGSDADLQLDFEDDASVAAFGPALASRLDGAALRSVFICSGLLHASGVRPERRIEALKADAYTRLMRVNALGPLCLMGQLKALLARDGPSQVSAVSARVGSIADNRLGGWYSYRCAKAALNMGFKTLAVELQRTHPVCALTLFHPGTTDTALSAPFQRGVAPHKLFSTARAADQFVEVVRRRETEPGLQFLAWDGQPVAW